MSCCVFPRVGLTTPFAVVAHRDHPLAKSTSLSQLKQAKWYLPTAKIGYFGELDALLFPEGEENTQTIIRGDTAAITLNNTERHPIDAQRVALALRSGIELRDFTYCRTRHFPRILRIATPPRCEARRRKARDDRSLRRRPTARRRW